MTARPCVRARDGDCLMKSARACEEPRPVQSL